MPIFLKKMHFGLCIWPFGCLIGYRVPSIIMKIKPETTIKKVAYPVAAAIAAATTLSACQQQQQLPGEAPIPGPIIVEHLKK